MKLFKRKHQQAGQLDPDRLPRHIAMIMDGNGRWATKRGLPRSAGYAVGAETFRRVATYCKNIGISYLTVYAFSTENWKRPAEEVSAIMEIFEKYLKEAIETMERDRVRMRFFGDTTFLSKKLQKLIAETEDISRRFEGVQVNMCVNYGGRDEILRAARLYAEDYQKTGAALDEAAFSRYMYSDGIPDPDLIIRPGGEMRVSNFLLWQSAYAEYYFTDVLWPDFDERELDRAILAFQNRDRRYGGVKGATKG
jgi:undecaprenyl diphosphate synthase